ncbi:S-adenosyl-L-methionine-dependent methyltransferase [Schizophyllum commune]
MAAPPPGPETVVNDDPMSWDVAWRKNITPWLKEKPQPALREIVESGAVEMPRGKDKRALVPGCGLGNDVAYLAATLGVTSVGVEISPKGLDVAQEKWAHSDLKPEVRALMQSHLADFFKMVGQYDLVYDYTFFVAIPPKRRAEWGRQMTALMRKNGLLLALVYPLQERDKGWGPPWFVRPEHYKEVLRAEDWELVFDEMPRTSEGDHVGRERMMVWRRK